MPSMVQERIEMEKLIEEAKAILQKYMLTPMNEIPEDDREKFNLAYLVVQAAIGRKAFEEFLKKSKW